MPVTLNKSGHRHPPGQIDHFRLRTGQRADFSISADGKDPVSANGDGLSFRHFVVNRDDFAAVKNEVRDLGYREIGYRQPNRDKN
jgi:hypothetical protein